MEDNNIEALRGTINISTRLPPYSLHTVSCIIYAPFMHHPYFSYEGSTRMRGEKGIILLANTQLMPSWKAVKYKFLICDYQE